MWKYKETCNFGFFPWPSFFNTSFIIAILCDIIESSNRDPFYIGNDEFYEAKEAPSLIKVATGQDNYMFFFSREATL